MATNPTFIATATLGTVAAAFGTALDGSTTPTTLVTGNASADTRVLEIDVKSAILSNSASLVNVFISKTGGATWMLFDAITLAAVTGSTSVASSSNSKTYQNLVLPSGTANLIGVLSTVNQATNVAAFGGVA